jgi:hypothetical protein
LFIRIENRHQGLDVPVELARHGFHSAAIDVGGRIGQACLFDKA